MKAEKDKINKGIKPLSKVAVFVCYASICAVVVYGINTNIGFLIGAALGFFIAGFILGGFIRGSVGLVLGLLVISLFTYFAYVAVHFDAGITISDAPKTTSAEDDLHSVTEAADSGEADAQYTLGTKYERGIGVPEDKEEAFEWYSKAAEQGHVRAQKEVGEMYLYGVGTPQDIEMAVTWIRKAAEQGNAKAQWLLGFRYEVGQLVPQDFIEAYAWYSLAAENEWSPDEQIMNDGRVGIAEHLSDEDLAAAQHRASILLEQIHARATDLE